MEKNEIYELLPDIKQYDELADIPLWVDLAIEKFTECNNKEFSEFVRECLKIGYAMGRNELK